MSGRAARLIAVAAVALAAAPANAAAHPATAATRPANSAAHPATAATRPANSAAHPATAATRPATAAAHPAGARIGAEQALAHVKRIERGRGIRTGRELSPALAELYARLPHLAAGDRQAAEALLARPDDGDADPDGTHKWTGPEDTLGGSPACGDHFCVHWTALGPDASDKPHAQQILGVLETEVYPCENGSAATACAGRPGLAWRNPALDAGRGGSDKVDVYIEDLYPTGVYGYVALDPDQTRDPSVPHYGYMVLDKDYTRYGDGSAASGLSALRVTAAHEYNHVLQNAYDYLEDIWMFESTAVYIEDRVYPDINDYLNYVNQWAANTRQPLTTYSQSNLKAYGSAVWNHWLAHRFGDSAVRAAWEQSVASGDFAPNAYGATIGAHGGAGFADEFGRFSAAVAEWNVPDMGFPDRYPDVPRDGTLPVEARTAPFGLPHTTFALFDVPIPAGAPSTIRLTATLPPWTASGVALVGRTGTSPTAGTVTTSFTPMPTGGTAATVLDNPSQFGRITAVVVNADPSQAGFNAQTDDYSYTKDAGDAVIALTQPGAPLVTTGAAEVGSEHVASTSGTVDPHLLDSTWFIEYGRTTDYGLQTEPGTLSASTLTPAQVGRMLVHLAADATYHYRVVASNSAGQTFGPDMTFKTPVDVTSPLLRVTLRPQRLRIARARGVVAYARCDEDCKGTLKLQVSRRTAKRLRVPTVLGSGRVVLGAARPKALRVRMSKTVRARLAHTRRRLTVTLAFSVADPSGNRRVVNKRLNLR